ncbi:MAG: thiamine diphosphokinase [Actinobacteria bacterium]|nr:thiamine diphosphokinase [Actinomycetota bacterium]
MHAVIIGGATLGGPLDPALLASADLLIAADSGADALGAVGLRPHLLVGDMDSVAEATWRALEAAGVETHVLPVEKDETDTEVALRLAVDRGADRITLLGALGGPRLDHLVAGLLLLTADWLEHVDVCMVDCSHEVRLAHGDVVVDGEPGDIVSLLPLTPSVHEIDTEGLLYPLRGGSLHQGAARGVSNELLGRQARVRHGEGRLLVIVHRPEGGPHDR